MSDVASTGSPTLRRSAASRTASQENAGSSEDMLARLVSFNFKISLHSPHQNQNPPQSPRSLSSHYLHHFTFCLPLPSSPTSRHVSSTYLDPCTAVLQHVEFEDILINNFLLLTSPCRTTLQHRSRRPRLHLAPTSLATRQLQRSVALSGGILASLHNSLLIWIEDEDDPRAIRFQ